jgi:subtilisin family serine protease
MAAKFYDATTPPRPGNAAKAIDFAVRDGAGIVLLSWDLGLGSNALGQAIRRACDAGALVVIACGNNGSDNDRLPWVPACYAAECPTKVITVMATDPYDDDRATFSNYGRQSVDLAAPGVKIVSTRRLLSKALAPGSPRYRRYSGTSQAAAHVAGAAALLKFRYPKLFAEDLKRCLAGKDSVDPIPGLKCASEGRLNIVKALECAKREYARAGLVVDSS